MEITVGAMPVSIRQTSSAAFTGVAPKGGSPVVDFVHYMKDGRYVWAHPENLAVTEQTDGGIFQFDTVVKVEDLRVFCASGTVSFFIEDLDGTNIVTCIAALAATSKSYATTLRPTDAKLYVFPNQRIRVTTTVAGIIELVVTRGDCA